MSEEGFIKHGMLTEDSMSDFDSTKKAAYYDKAGPGVADEANKSKLQDPVKILDPWTEKPAKVAKEYPLVKPYPNFPM